MFHKRNYFTGNTCLFLLVVHSELDPKPTEANGHLSTSFIGFGSDPVLSRFIDSIARKDHCDHLVQVLSNVLCNTVKIVPFELEHIFLKNPVLIIRLP